MVKGNPKSSASSATRKKHAKKTATPDEPPLPNANQKRPKTKAERKLSKKEPRVKMYIPPVKPAPVQPDPLETTGLARTLPADLLVVLRNISKKAQVTKIRALEELQTGWVEKWMQDSKEGSLADTLVKMLPVWLHHVSALFLHPSRRVRFLAVSLHASFLRIPAVRDQILFFLRETASPSQAESILGTWSLAAHDVDRAVSTTASKAWKETILSPSDVKEGSSSSGEQLVLDDDLISSIASFVQRTALDPAGIYEYLNPLPPIATAFPPAKKGQPGGRLSAMATPRKDDSGTQTPRSKTDEQEEGEQDRKARLRISALGATRWIFSTTSNLSEDLLAFSSNPALWTALHPNESCPWIDGFESFGFAQPNVRKAAWVLVQTLLDTQKDRLETIVPVLGIAILRSAWVELDSIVQGAMWQPLLMFLKQFPQSWTLDDTRKDDDGGSGSEAESDNELVKTVTPSALPKKQVSEAYLEFLQFLQLGCSGSPLQGYPTVVIILSTIPSSVMTSSIITDATALPLREFFASFWAAVDGRALSSLHRSATSAAFLSSLLECTVFLIKRMRASLSRPDPDRASTSATTSNLGGSSLSISEPTRGLVADQYNHIWNELGSRRLKVEERAAARLLGKTMEDLGNIDHELMDVAWEVFVDGVRRGSIGVDDVRQHESGPEQQQQHETPASKTLISATLKVFFDRFKDGTVLKKRVIKLVKEVLDGQVERIHDVERLEGEKCELLISMLDQFREGLFFDEGFSSRLDNLLAQHAFLILDLSPSLLLSYLLYRKNTEKCLAVWHSLLSSIASTVTILASREERIPEQKSIVRLLDAAQQGQLPSYLKPKGGELDALVGGLLEKALTGLTGSDEVGLVRQILKTSDFFISKSGYNTILQIIIATFGSLVKQAIDGKEVQLVLFEVAIDFVDTIFGKLSSSEEAETLLKSVLPDIFLFGYLLPLCDRTVDSEDLGGSHSHAVAKSLWEGWIKSAKEDVKGEVVGVIKMKLKMFIEDTHVHPLPEDVLLMLSINPPGIHVDLLKDIFPSATQLDSMLDDLSPDAIDPSIAVLDSLIPPQAHSKPPKSKQETDRHGFTTYARIVSALLQVSIGDRQLAKRTLWALRHFLALSVYAQDLRNVPSPASSSAFSSPSKHDSNNYSPVFDHEVVTMSALRDVVSRVKQVSVYLLGSVVGQDDDGSWRKEILVNLLKDTPANGKIDTSKATMSQVQQFLWDIIAHAKEQDKLRDTRVLKIILDAVFSDGVDVGEADLWIQLARKLEKNAPQTSMTIIAAITATGAEPPRLDRYRNEIAASLLGIKPHKANTEGLLALRKLPASAPDPDGDVVFLTSPRAINVVKACQGWVLADGDDGDGDEEEEMEERVESAMLPIFMYLAPILQNVPGGHWAFVFDVLEGVLERASLADRTPEDGEAGEMGEGLVALTRALRLVLLLEELAARNKSLMAEWEGRRTGVLVLIRDLSVLGFDSMDVSSVPRSTCRELVLSIVQHLPSSLIDHDTLSKMCHLIQDPSPTVQKKAYQLLQAAAKKRTEYFVIEVAVDTEGVVQAELPMELMAIIQRDMQFGFGFSLDEGIGGEGEDTTKEQNHHAFGYLLAWMLVFDLFRDASFKVKSNYIEQLRNQDVVVEHLIPCLLILLQLDQGSPSKVFKLDLWGIDEFYIDLYEPGNPHTIPVLAAHLYYRALLTIPSLIHSWILDCKDRQLTTTVTSYTSSYFSPVLIRAELEHVRTNCTASAGGNSTPIADENMSIKVAQAINEVVAAYSVDEHQLEIKFKFPTDWPLHRVEIKDVKMVGVEERRWRAWVLGVQQTICAHNGRIVDGLSLFKKNVTLHFEGQVECAICYSIISVMDGSLPKKPCKTCKNRFHAGCLYKWFNSSHSSSCPLCRSDIM